MLKVERIPGKGRGVIALRNIKKGEIIERSPVINIPCNDIENIRQTRLKKYWFCWGEDMKERAIALGFGSLFNHSYNPNAVYVNRLDDMCIEFKALRDIPKGQEITINYNRNPEDKSPVSFTVVN